MIYKSLFVYALYLFATTNIEGKSKQNFKDVSRRLLFDSSFVSVKKEQQGSYEFWKHRHGKDIENLNKIEFESKLRELNMTRESFNERYNTNIKYSDDSIDSEEADIVRKVLANADSKKSSKNTANMNRPSNTTNGTTTSPSAPKKTIPIPPSTTTKPSSSSMMDDKEKQTISSQNQNQSHTQTATSYESILKENQNKAETVNTINSLNSDESVRASPNSDSNSHSQGQINGMNNGSGKGSSDITKRHNTSDPEIFAPVNADGSLVFSHVPVNFSTTDIQKSDNGTYVVISSNTTGHLNTTSKIEIFNHLNASNNQSDSTKSIVTPQNVSSIPVDTTTSLPPYPPEFDLANGNNDPNRINSQESDADKLKKELPVLPIDIVPIPKTTTTTSTSETAHNKLNATESSSSSSTVQIATKDDNKAPPVQPSDIPDPSGEPEILQSTPGSVPTSEVPSTPAKPSAPTTQTIPVKPKEASKEPISRPYISSSTLRCTEVPN